MHSLRAFRLVLAGERNRAPNAMDRQLVQEAEDSVLQKGNEVGFGCYRSAQPVPRRNKVLALTTASLSHSPHATADSLSSSLCTTAASLSPRPHHMPLLPHSRPHHCCLTFPLSVRFLSAVCIRPPAVCTHPLPSQPLNRRQVHADITH